jgi:hypothetical protein
MLMTILLGSANAFDGEELDPEIYDVASLDAGMTDRETNTQLQNDREPNAIIIKFHPRSMFPGREHQYNQAVEQVLRWGFRYEPIDGLEETYVVYNDELERNPNAVMNRFKNNRFIEYVEPNFIGTFGRAPNDPQYTLRGSGHARIINAEAGWAIITDSSVPVAIIDSGMSGSTDMPAPFRAYNVITRNNNITDNVNHGTGVAGVVGAIGNNGVGASGVVWNASLLYVKVSEVNNVSVANVANGIIWAVDNGARVLNLSVGNVKECYRLCIQQRRSNSCSYR